MNVVIIGSRSRSSQTDKEAVSLLVTQSVELYQSCTFVTTFTTQREGIGSYVLNECFKTDSEGRFKHNDILGFWKYKVIDLKLSVHSSYRDAISWAEQTKIDESRNIALLEIGDIFFYFASEDRKGMLEALMKKVSAQSIPNRIFLPNDKIDIKDMVLNNIQEKE